MNLIVFGPTGGTGREVVRQALGAGHSVTAYARTPEKLQMRHDRLRVVKGDVFDAAAVVAACEGQEAALVTLGGKPRGPQPCAAGTLHAIQGLHKHGGKRIVVETALGVGDSHGGWLFEKLLVPLLLRAEMADKEQQEQLVRSGGLDWVIARPGGLTNAPPKYAYRAAAQPDHPSRIARADVAHFMLAQLESDAWLGQAVGLSD